MNNSKKKFLLRAGVIAMLVIMALSFIIAPVLASTPPVSSVAPVSSSSSVAPPVTPPTGTPYVTAYTVTDSGNKELQKITAGQKCVIIVTILDPRITSDFYYTYDTPEASRGTCPDGVTPKTLIPNANFKITTTGSYSPPSFGDIRVLSVKNDKLTSNGALITVVLNDITYLGGDNTLGFDIAYDDNGRPLVSLTQKISQCSDAAEVAGTPSTLLITNASYGNEKIMAGSEFTVTATVRAAGGTAGAKNVSVALTLPEQITVASGSPNIFVGDISADKEQTITFKLIASAVANAGSYGVTITANSTSTDKAAASTASMPLTIPISQPERFEISRFNLSEYMALNEDNYATVSLINKGKGAIYNVSAEIQGEGFECPDGKLFIGNIAAGTENNSDITIRAVTVGVHKALLTVTYEDDKATEKTLTKEITITVEDNSGNMGGDIGMMPDIGANVDMPEQNVKQGMPWWVWVIIVVAVIIAVVVVIVILKKKKAHKIAAQLMEDDDETI